MSANPITPEEAKKKEGAQIPSVVIEAVNELIQAKLSHNRAVIKQDEVINKILQKIAAECDAFPKKMQPDWAKVTRADIFEKNWLDFEPVFRRAGWIVEYDRPGYDESYDANWTFKANR